VISTEHWARVFAWARRHTLRQPREINSHWKKRVMTVARKRIEDERLSMPVISRPPIEMREVRIDFSQSVAELREELMHSKQTKLRKAKARYQR